jgi:hypothetical protein
MVLSLLWVGLLQFFASIFIWTTLAIANVAFIAGSIWLYFYWQQCSANLNGVGATYQAAYRSILDTVGISSTVATTQSTVYYLNVIFVIVAVFAGILVLVTIAMIKRITMAVRIMKEASKALMKMPLITIFPCGASAVMGLLLVYFIYILMFLVTPNNSTGTVYVASTGVWTDPAVNNTLIALHVFGVFKICLELILRLFGRSFF